MTNDESLSIQEEHLLAEFRELWDKVQQIWDTHSDAPAFRAYVSADYEPIFNSLRKLRGKACTFLEWGSGLGVVAIMASRMGFDAYGIEVEPELVEYAEELAEMYGAETQFAIGSFIPDEFEWEPVSGDEFQRSFVDIGSAYDELDMELRDFDIVYAYPWPDEHSLFHSIMRQFGCQNALLLSYDVRDGMEVTRFNSKR